MKMDQTGSTSQLRIISKAGVEQHQSDLIVVKYFSFEHFHKPSFRFFLDLEGPRLVRTLVCYTYWLQGKSSSNARVVNKRICDYKHVRHTFAYTSSEPKI